MGGVGSCPENAILTNGIDVFGKLRSVEFPTIEILGVPIACLERASALRLIQRLHGTESPSLVVYANAHTLNLAWSDPSYRDLLRRAGAVLNDGAGVAMGARISGGRFPENLNGSDFNPLILRLAAGRRWPVYLLGGREGVAERAAHNLKTLMPDLEIVGTHHGYVDAHDTASLVEEIRASGAEVLMVAMGNPTQEIWLDAHLASTGARIGLGVGAFFDFSAGEVPRAPSWMNRAGLEWIYRLKQEPRRMWRRYLAGNPLFLMRVAKQRLRPTPGPRS